MKVNYIKKYIKSIWLGKNLACRFYCKINLSDETRLTLHFYYMIHLKVITVESKLETEDLGGISAG